jgi:hypothetical protein
MPYLSNIIKSMTLGAWVRNITDESGTEDSRFKAHQSSAIVTSWN